ncbi:MAG: acyl-CoA dehydrogenase family protein, partial [Mycobacterium sp.]|nr:acyl-CoA dehydrogenase family protein [Mycobacterium sp.]
MTRDTPPSLHEIADTAAELAELRTTADDILAQAWTTERARVLLDGPDPAFDENVWKTVVDMGWPDVLVAETRGGGGGTLRELCVLAEASGAAALPVPLAAAAAANWCEQRSSGELTLVLDEVGTLVGDEVSGTWPIVPFGGVADRLLVLAHRDGEPVLGVVEVGDRGVQRAPEQPLDHGPSATISLERTPLRPIATGAGAATRHHEAVSRSRLATVAELVGIASSANDAAVDYAKMRKTFGQPIGARQAIKHRLVDQRCVIEIARALVNRAADACELQHPDAEPLVSLAVFWAIDSLRRVPE